MRVRGGPLLAAPVAAAFAGIALAAGDPSTPVIADEPAPRVGETLTASGATIYKWQRCDPGTDPCAPDASQNASGWQHITGQERDASTYTLTLADQGMMIRVLGKDTNQGTKFAPSNRVGPVAPAPGETSRPIFGQTGALEPLEGTVLVSLPGSDERVEVDQLTQVPMGAKVDVSNGSVLLTTQKKPSGGLQSVELWAGAFALSQRRNRNVTELKLVNSSAGVRQSRSGAQTAGHRKRRKLWGRGKCRCRHRGRNSSGTARGTWWLTAERPKGTLTRVKKGKVLVRDFKRRKKVLVKAGHKYLARR